VGYYLNVNGTFEFKSEEALIEAAHRLQPSDVGLVTDVQSAWQVIISAWEECAEYPEFALPSDEDGAASPLVFFCWAPGGKWYSSDWERMSAALVGLATGTLDCNEDIDVIWRERLHADGTFTQHPGKIVYEGDEDDDASA
jgi:hypothetical protein